MTIPGGYILISRKLIESEIYNKPPLYMKVWIYLLSEAKFKRTDRLERGQLFTTLAEIQEACSWYVGYRKETPSKSKIYRVIDWLRKTGERVHEQDMTDKMIETTKVTQGMVITVVNYDYYQTSKNYERNTDRNNEQGTNATRPKQQRNNRLKERNKNDNKNGKKDNNNLSDKSDELPTLSKLPRKKNKNRQYPEVFENIWELYPSRKGSSKKGQAYKKIRARIKEGISIDDLKKATENYKLYCKEQDNINTRYVMTAETFYGASDNWLEYLDYVEEKREGQDWDVIS